MTTDCNESGMAGLGAAPCSAIDVAHQWLKKSRQEWNGHISTWTPEQMDSYHRDLGLLVDFVTDCWPNAEHSNSHPEKIS